MQRQPVMVPETMAGRLARLMIEAMSITALKAIGAEVKAAVVGLSAQERASLGALFIERRATLLAAAAANVATTHRPRVYEPRVRPQVGKVAPCLDCGGMVSMYRGDAGLPRHGAYMNFPGGPECRHGQPIRMDCLRRPVLPRCCAEAPRTEGPPARAVSSCGRGTCGHGLLEHGPAGGPCLGTYAGATGRAHACPCYGFKPEVENRHA